MNIQEVRDLIHEFAEENFGEEGEVTKLTKVDQGWEGELELSRVDEYKIRHGRPQTIERYTIKIEEGKVVSFEKVETRSRGEVAWQRE